MDFISALDISASALSASRTNINIVAMNLANVKTTRTQDGNPYRRKTVVLEATPLDASFAKSMQDALTKDLRGVRVSAIATDQRPHRMVFEPGHPDANADGYVAYPDINVVEEMAALMTAQRGYEANVNVVDAIKQMYTQALQINR